MSCLLSGARDIEIGVDSDGFIFLGFEAVEMNDESEFLWSRNYTEPTDAKKTKTETRQNRWVLHVQQCLVVSISFNLDFNNS